MQSVSAQFLAAIRAPHTVRSYVDVMNGSTVLYADVPIASGSVTLDRTADVRGRVELALPADAALVPDSITDLLAPNGNELRVRRGIQIGSTWEGVALGVFRITNVQVSDPERTIKITGLDRSQVIREANFEDAYVIAPGTNYVTALAAMVTNAAAWIPMSFMTTTATTPTLIYDKVDEGGRWKALQEMATALGGELFFNGAGTLILRAEADPGATPVWGVDDGAAGVIVKVDRAWSRDQSYNAAIVTSSGPGIPYRSIARDTDPTSATYYFGSFGKKPRRYASPLINSQAQADSAAAAILRRSLGITQSLNLDAIPNPALEPGDVVAVRRTALGLNENAVIDEMKIGLLASDGMNLKVRARQVLL